MTTRTVSNAPGPAAPAQRLHRVCYQDVLRQLAVLSLIATMPGAGLATRSWLGQARMRRSWPPGASR